jgi:hypothetical protein
VVGGESQGGAAGGGGVGGYDFWLPACAAKCSGQWFFWRLLPGSHFGRAFGRAPRFVRGAESVQALAKTP